MNEHLNYLREAHRNGNLIPFIGAGYGASEAGLPSWPQLLGAGTAYLRSQIPRSVPAQKVRTLEALAKSGDLPAAFQFFQGLFTDTAAAHYDSVRYQGFFNDLFHEPEAHPTGLTDALRALSPRVAITTNYDLLLEKAQVTPGRRSVTWLDTAGIRSLLRSESGVIHLHGRYDVPRSIILSSSDYQRIVLDNDSEAIAQAAFHSGVLMFLGSSVGGLSDPHMGKLLAEFARISDRTKEEQSPHIALFNGRLPGVDIAQMRAYGIEAVSYGDDYADLPQFLDRISENETITISSPVTRSLVNSINHATTAGAALGHIAKFIEREVFPGRTVRITFCELVETADQGMQLEARHVLPLNATHNVFNYPLSIAAWSLVEGRIVAWPQERDVLCNIGLLERMGRLDRVRSLLSSKTVRDSPEIQKYVDLARVTDRFERRELTLGDFFQDWSAGQPDHRYNQFICLPVPVTESFGNRERIREYGVFNIDSQDGNTLLDRRSAELLKLASALAAAVCERKRPAQER